ncbi:elongation factor 3 [Achlya hypogyna]|uniref:Elongation factor 3 n=1 Tax=Achlya hypogyna TaxID=1202772 RepID=A0A1V9YUA3_ACHHY|nr:elongation factor 3 [Achlya hypogyna]
MATQHFTEALKQAFSAGAENAAVAATQVAALVLNNKELELNGVAAQLSAALADNDANTRQTVCAVIAAIANNKEARVEPYLAPLLGAVLDLYADKKMQVRAPAAVAAKAIVQSGNQNSLRVLLPQIFSGLDRTKKWQTKEGALNLIHDLAELHPVQVSRCLPDIMPNASEQMWDTRPEVKKAAHALMIKVCSTASNADIEPFIPALISCIANPSEVAECVHKLASTTFVKTVEAPALAIMEPLLVRGLNENKTAVKRQTAVIIDNMCKLVEDPAEALLFTPKVLPTLKRIIEAVADPECRDVCKRAHETLFMAAGSVELSEDETKVEFSSILDALKFSLEGDANGKKAKIDDATLNFVAGCGLYLTVARNFKPEDWSQSVRPYFAAFMKDADIPHVTKAFREKCYKDNKVKVADDVVQEDEGEDLCDCEFSLAYGGMILLNNARMNLKKGHRYGLCGPNGCGKSTLMRAIANGQLEGFPSKDELKTVYVEHNLQAEEAELSVVDFVLNDPDFKDMPRKEVQDTLSSVGFTDAMQAQAVGSLSGGWKMKLELARAMLQKADILLLDEPTNHLDVANVAWLENYLTSMGTITSLIVSHDSGFLDNVCTNIIHYEKNRKLKTYVGNMSKFVELRPEAKAYYDLDAATIAFKFPEPGFLADIKNKGKPIIRLTNCSYTYPGASKPSINDVTITCALSSRIAVIGPNGAGKSTMIKMLTGETEPTTGTVWKHPAMRFAYVAQHAFHHIEQHLDISANQYIQWRFQSGEDKELMAKETRKLTPEEKELLTKPVNWEGEKRIFESIENRRKLKKSFEYEVKWQKLPDTENSWIPREKLEKWGFDKILQIADDREAARANMQARPVTALAVQKHLDNFGLGAEFGTHSRMRGLSGGQKVKVVLAAAMWLNPHILVLDEPTNFLDRDSLGALAGAIKEFGGGVVMISHNREFTDALAIETWNVVAGQLSIDGQVPEDKTKIEQIDAEESVDAFGNKVVTKVKRKLTRKELKAKLKAKKDAEKRGEYYSDSDLDGYEE